MSPVSRTEPPAAQQEPVGAGAGQEGGGEPRTHFDVQVQDAVLVQVADPLQDLPHVGPDLRESRGRAGTLSVVWPRAGPLRRRVRAVAPFAA